MGRSHGRAIVSVPAADGIFGQGVDVGEYGRAAQPAEFRVGIRERPYGGSECGFGGYVRRGRVERSGDGAEARDRPFPGWAGGADDDADARGAIERSPDFAGAAGRSGEAGE